MIALASPDESAFVSHRKRFRRHLKALSFFRDVFVLQPRTEIYIFEIGLHHDDSVVVLASRMALDGQRSVTAYGQLEWVHFTPVVLGVS